MAKFDRCTLHYLWKVNMCLLQKVYIGNKLVISFRATGAENGEMLTDQLKWFFEFTNEEKFLLIILTISRRIINEKICNICSYLFIFYVRKKNYKIIFPIFLIYTRNFKLFLHRYCVFNRSTQYRTVDFILWFTDGKAINASSVNSKAHRYLCVLNCNLPKLSNQVICGYIAQQYCFEIIFSIITRWEMT